MKGTDIQHLAQLARIQMDAAEMDAIATDLSSILEYVSQIGEVAEALPRQSYEHRNIMRPDEVRHVSGSYTLDLIRNAPQSDDAYVVVQKIL